MISAPEVITTEAQIAAVIRLTIPRAEMRSVFGPAVGELLKAIAAQGVEPVGGVFAHHLRMTPDTFDFELGIKVSAPVTASGRVQPGSLPAVRAVRTVYSGGYEGLPDAWGAFMTWIKDHGHAPAEDLWELYAVGPQSSGNPADWRTELVRPLT